MSTQDSSSKLVRVRIAPSPTGPLHIGTARTALFNYLFTQKHGGDFVLRIEDTDTERSRQKWEQDIIDNLHWLGLEWEEGPQQGGSYGPYRQSERLDLYQKYLKKLLSKGKAYYCFCTEEELETEKQAQIKAGAPVRYSGRCRNLSSKEVEEKLEENSNPVIRFKTPKEKLITFEDKVRGKVEFNSKELDDFIIAKNLQQPLYNFAVVVDDYEMHITHVIRGEDHLSNTPKQILIRQALDFPSFQYGHLPLVLGKNGGKLSKREAITSVKEYRQKGYLPETLVNFSALLGWHPPEDRELYSLPELVEKFSLNRVKKGGAAFNLKKLDWMNGVYIREQSLSDLTKLCISYLIKVGYIKETEEGYEIVQSGEQVKQDYLQQLVAVYQDRLKYLSEISDLVAFLFTDIDYDKELLRWKDQDDKELIRMIDKVTKLLSRIRDWSEDNITDTILEEANKLDDRGKILWPLRAALTGKKESAGPFEVAFLLGKEKSIRRLKKARRKVKNK